MSQQQSGPAIANEAAFLNVLGVNPGIVRQGTLGVEFIQGVPHLSFGVTYPVDAGDLAAAFAAAAPSRPAPGPELPDGCVGEHSPGDNEDCTEAPVPDAPVDDPR